MNTRPNLFKGEPSNFNLAKAIERERLIVILDVIVIAMATLGTLLFCLIIGAVIYAGLIRL